MKPKHSEPRYTLDLSTAQVVMLAQAMEVYSNKSYGSADDYNPEPLETLRAPVDGLARRLYE